MFDLFRSREKSVRILLGALLVLVALSMLTYLIPSYGTGATNTSDTVIATVGGDSITMLDMQKLIQDTLKARQLPPSAVATFIPADGTGGHYREGPGISGQATRSQVSDADVAVTIRQTIPNLFPDGKFVGKDAYAAHAGAAESDYRAV